jgi:hypothetical protein
MAYFKEKLRRTGDKTPNCFGPFYIGKVSDKCLPTRTFLYISLKQVLINLTSFMGTPNSIQYFPTQSIIGFLEDYE